MEEGQQATEDGVVLALAEACDYLRQAKAGSQESVLQSQTAAGDIMAELSSLLLEMGRQVTVGPNFRRALMGKKPVAGQDAGFAVRAG